MFGLLELWEGKKLFDLPWDVLSELHGRRWKPLGAFRSRHHRCPLQHVQKHPGVRIATGLLQLGGR
jgi:hypothetical protein